MTYRLTLPPGSKVTEDRVLRGFMANIKAGVDAGDPGSIVAHQRAERRLIDLRGERMVPAERLKARKLP